MTDMNPASENSPSGMEGKYLTFTLADTEYGVPILRVREIISMMEVTAMPRVPEYVRGVLNLRGTIIPIVDLRTILDLPRTEDTDKTRIVVVDLEGTETGVVIDFVHEVVDIDDEHIQERPEFGPDVPTDFVLGMSQQGDRVTILLDIDAALTGNQKQTLSQIAKAA